MNIFIIDFSILTLIVLLSYLIGFSYIHFLLPNLKDEIKNDFYKSFSYSISIGFLFSTSLLSVLFTGFNSLFIYPFVFFILPFFFTKQKGKRSELINGLIPTKKQFGLVLFLLTLIFSYNLSVYYRDDGYLFYDLVYYGKLASSIFTTGIENRISIYSSFIDVKSQMLYHYGDLWLVGGISKLFQLSEVKVLVYVIYPFFHFIVLFLIISIYSNKGKILLPKVFLAFGLLYGIKLFLNLDFENEVLNASKQYRGLPYPTTANKFLIIYLITLFSYSLYRLQFIRYSFIVLSFLPIFYSVTVPSIAGIGVLLILIPTLNIKLKNKLLDIKYNDSLFVILGVVFLIGYTYFQPFESSEELKIQIYSIKTYIVLFVETFIKIFLEYFFVFILLLWVILKTKGRIVLQPWILISFVGLLSGFAFIYIHSPSIFNLHQVLSNVSPVFLLIISIVLLEELKENHLKYLILLLSIFSVWNLTYFKQIPKEFGIRKTSTTFSAKFQNEVNTFIQNSDSDIKAVSIRTIFENEFREGDNSSWKYDFQNKFQDLYYSRKISFPLEFGAFFKNVNNEYDYTHPYFKMYRDRKVSNSRIIRFLDKTKVDVLFVEKSIHLPSIFSSKYKLLFSDKLTGDSFWIKNN